MLSTQSLSNLKNISKLPEDFLLEAREYLDKYLSGKEIPDNIDVVKLPDNIYVVTCYNNSFIRKIWSVKIRLGNLNFQKKG